jgi:hypothetical protein
LIKKGELLEGIKAQEKNVTAIAKVVNAFSGMKHPGEYTTLETLNNVTLDDVKQITQPISHRKTPI